MSDLVHRKMARCVRCRRWMSVIPDAHGLSTEICPCGGATTVLTPSEWVSHIAQTPYRTSDQVLADQPFSSIIIEETKKP